MARDAGADVFERVLALKSFQPLSGLHAEDLAAIAKRVAPASFPPGEELLAAPELLALHFVMSGSGREERGGRRFRAIGAGDLVGGLEVLSGASGSASVMCETAIEVLSLTRSDLLDLLEDHFDIWLAAARSLASAALWLPNAASPGQGEGPDAERIRVTPTAFALADRIALLRATPLFDGLPVHALGRIAADANLVDLAPGTAVWSRGDPATDAWVVVHGSVEVGAAQAVPAPVHGAGLLGLDEALADRRRGSDVVAREPLRALRITVEALLDELEDDPGTANDLLVAFARRVHGRVERAAAQWSEAVGVVGGAGARDTC